MPRSRTRVMPAIMVTAVLPPQASCPWPWGQNHLGCGLCSWKFTACGREARLRPHMSTAQPPRPDPDTDPENAGSFAASQVCTESWLG